MSLLGRVAAAEDKPDAKAKIADDVAQWVSAHSRVMRIWDLKGFRRESLTPSARQCIDESGSTQEKGLIEGNALLACARIGATEVLSRRIPQWRREYEGSLAEARVKWMGAVFGAEVVSAEDSRSEAKAEIAKQKKYSRYGGVIDKSALYASQQQIRAADEEIDRMKGLAKEAQVKVLGRTHEQTVQAAECILSHANDVDETLRAVRSFAVDDQDCLWILILHLELEDGETLRNWTARIFSAPPPGQP